MPKNIRIIGILCLVVGAFTVLAALYYPPVGMLSAIVGFILSSIYISMVTRNEIEVGYFNPGYIGLLLSSTPLLLFFYFFITR